VTKKALTYKEAGVDLEAQDDALRSAKDAIRATFTRGVMGDVGLFGGLFDPAQMGFENAILVSSADGVGTKLEVAKRAGIYDTGGRGLARHLGANGFEVVEHRVIPDGADGVAAALGEMSEGRPVWDGRAARIRSADAR